MKPTSFKLEGNFTETLERATRTLNVDPQTGFAPAIWNSWVNNWTGQEEEFGSETRTAIQRREFDREIPELILLQLQLWKTLHVKYLTLVLQQELEQELLLLSNLIMSPLETE